MLPSLAGQLVLKAIGSNRSDWSAVPAILPNTTKKTVASIRPG